MLSTHQQNICTVAHIYNYMYSVHIETYANVHHLAQTTHMHVHI